MGKIVYLSGAIGGLSYDDAIAWRVRATTMLVLAEIQTLDPMRGKEHLEDLGEIPALITEDKVGWIGSPNWLVHRDLADIQRCDALLVELTEPDHPYRGTIMEMVYARLWNKPVVVWSSWANSSPWITYHSTLVCETLEECCDAVKELLL